MNEYCDASGRLTIHLDDTPAHFEVYASRLQRRCGKLLRRLDALDQGYWDFEVDGITIVLHWDTFAGVSLHVGDGSHDALLRATAASICPEA
jgi:hypothetical protein